MTIIPLYLMCFLQCLKQCAYHKNVVGISTVGTAAVRNVGVIHTGIEQDGLQGCGKFLRSIVLYNAFKWGHVVFRFHGLVLLSVKFHNVLRLEVEYRLTVVDAFLADAPVGEGDALVLVFLGNVDDGLEYGVAHTVSVQHVLHVMERNVVPFCNLFQVCQRSVPAQDSLQLAESLTVFRGGKITGVYQRADIASGEELDEPIYNSYPEMWIKPHGKSYCHMIISTPSTLLICVSSLFLYDEAVIFRSPYMANEVLFFKSCQKLLCLCCTKPSVRSFVRSIRLSHLGEVYHAVVDTLAGHRHFVSLNVEDFNQILIRGHIDKNCDIKEKPPVGVTSTYAGRMQPVVSARPP
uniref:Uncharacterized protein n=1 Tax=Myoviridae sp. ctAbS6 TaxID=2826628 RepID=A0A8S5M741_9CAUD|nr:MAG TPA: hypothetical protein [Myoviridae sp. ctAbS6]